MQSKQAVQAPKEMKQLMFDDPRNMKIFMDKKVEEVKTQ